MTGRELAPTPKMQAAGASGALAVVLVWAAGLAGVDVPPEVAAAFTILAGCVAGYLTADRSSPARHLRE